MQHSKLTAELLNKAPSDASINGLEVRFLGSAGEEFTIDSVEYDVTERVLYLKGNDYDPDEEEA